MQKGGFSLKSKTMANSVDPDEMAHYIWIYPVCEGICFGLPGCKG